MTQIALAQITPVVGDIGGNIARILTAYEKAAAQGAELVVFPELVLTGYPAEDLILMPDFRQKVIQATHNLAEKTLHGPAMIIGSLWEDNHIYNAALLLGGGKIQHTQYKTMLPNYGVFDEKRLFSAGGGAKILHWRGKKLGILICEDMWYPELATDYKKLGAELLIIINASPFEAGKLAQRKEVALRAVKQAGVPLIYVNMVGGQDELVFDGGSFVMSAQGHVTLQMPEFEEGLIVVSDDVFNTQYPALNILSTEGTLWHAMMLGLHDYINKNGFKGVLLGLSGGIDSAVSTTVAVDALGAENVRGVLLPSPYTSRESTEDALSLAKNLGIHTDTIPITPGMEMFENVLSPLFNQPEWMKNPSVGGNLQARLRGIILMAMSNRFGWMLLSTGNKSEISVGYSTLYGDSCGGYNVLKDAYKMQVYALARWRNKKNSVIPQRSIDKAPSAELAPSQKDEDQLPPYDILDKILFQHIELRQSADAIIAQGFAADIVHKVVKMVRLSEYKRRQSCPGVKLSPMLFGKDRRYPLTNKF